MPARDVTVIASSPRSVWIGVSGGGVFRTDDGGATWSLKSEGMKNRGVHMLVRDAASGALFAETEGGVDASADGGERWTGSKEGITSNTDVSCLAVDPKSPRTLYARDDFWAYKSTDGGATWKKNEQDLDVSGTINGLFAMT